MGDKGNRRYKERAIHDSKVRVGEMRKEQEKSEHEILSKEKSEWSKKH